ncbi:hypothetical protein B4O97_01910 [Marispirochaeta aestuarii]|uniref:C4-dicarboxylate ABC transporter substrate-binding protein n=1 Tax=Marispirochaeta aestuarii TaxID=1963862 RepID=A0A1Y1S342_9SPIO|nr:TRAP transporter substrate-binding protein [Marispirochaeta aestuarii]ORC37781.1 hypothetical protein B4O97_01910 [Marispirochaeta aestuarii]
MRRVVSLTVLFLLAGFTLWAGGEAEGAAAGEEKLVLTFAHETVEPHPVYLWGERFKENVEKMSGGKMEIDIYPAAELGPAMENAQQAKMGTVDMANLSTPIVQFVDGFGVFDLPFIFKNRDHAYAVAWGEIGEELSRRLIDAHGLRILTYYENGFRQITNNVRPIDKPEDLKGLRIRTPSSEIRVRTFETFGAAASALSFPEVYGALQSGTFDGQENPIINIYSAQLNEVQKYLSITNHVYAFQKTLINEKKYQSLSQEQKDVLHEAAQEASEWVIQFIVDNETDMLNEMVEETGLKVNTANNAAFRKVALEQIWPNYTDRFGELIEKINKAGEQY